LTGLHTHLGSQLFEPEPYQEAILALCRLAQETGFYPEEISPGGGWGVPYHPGDEASPVETWVTAVSTTLVTACQSAGFPLPRLVLEPGRWLAARAGVAVYTLGTHKTLADGTLVAAVDGGLADNPRPALYQAQYTACLVDQPQAAAAQRLRLVGKYCESGDVLIQEVELPDFKRGDRVALPVAGAYQLSMASNYNLAPRPAVLWLEEGEVPQVLQAREEIDEASWWNG
jgi:diaminopimelate decarboxylase